MDSWYFAYGSNLLKKQMIERVGTIGDAEHPPRIARLENHRLVFQQLSPDGPAYANIQRPGDGVIGVVYRCREAELEMLDDYERGYERRPITVTDLRAEILNAVAYFIVPTEYSIAGKPSDEYLARIITGAREHGLPEEYLDTVTATAFR